MAECELVELEPGTAAVVGGEVPLEELPGFFGEAFSEVMAAVEAAGVAVTGPPFGYYPTVPGQVVTVEAGIPVAAAIHGGGRVHTRELPGGPAVVAVHVGPFDTLGRTYAELGEWVAEHGYRTADAMWEQYLSDPAAEPDPTTWRTRIVWPLRAAGDDG